MAAIAVIGNLARDLVDGRPPRAGGAPFHAARALRALDIPALVLTKCSPEDRRTLLPSLARLGVRVCSREAASTSTFAFRYDGDRRIMTVEQLGEPWTPDEACGWVTEALGRTAWVHVGPLARSDFPAETLAVLARGRRLSLDAQGLVRAPQTGPLKLDAEFDRELLRHVTVLKLAEEEADVVLETLDDEAVAALGVPEVLVTLGSRGSILFCGGTRHRIVANPVETDPTGAGDAFMACYLAARARGGTPLASARRATRLVEDLLAGRLR